MTNEETRPLREQGPGLESATDDDQDDQNPLQVITVVGSAAGYASASREYQRKGWHPVPIQKGQRWPPPTGFIGKGRISPSGADIEAWSEDRPNDNIAIVMPDGVIGIDVDHTARRLAARPSPSTRRDWGGSRGRGAPPHAPTT